jgi:hypothetical protein
MVDPIEIKLEEIEEHVLKMQADVDRLMRDFSKPEKGKELLAQLSGGSGSGGSSAMSAGLIGGMAAGGVMALVQIVGESVKQSKILSTVLGTIGKAMGLLIDVILLPFLPILTTGIIWLFQGIMLFHRLWSTIWSSKVMQLLVQGLTALVGIFGKGIAEHLTLGIKFADAITSTVWTVIEWIWGLATSNGVAGLTLNFVLGPIGMLLNWLYSVIVGNETPSMKLMLSVEGTAMDFLTWLWNTITSGGANLVINVTDSASKSVSSAASAVGSVASDPLGWLGGAASQIAGSGAAGPMAQAAQSLGTQIFNFNGYNTDQLRKAVDNILRIQKNRTEP